MRECQRPGNNNMQPKQTQPVDGTVSQLGVQAHQAFYRYLPDLLKKHPRQWIAFHGEQLIDFGATQTELYQLCVRRGLTADEFVILFADEAALGDQH
jgi:hypothetical protein